MNQDPFRLKVVFRRVCNCRIRLEACIFPGLMFISSSKTSKETNIEVERTRRPCLRKIIFFLVKARAGIDPQVSHIAPQPTPIPKQLQKTSTIASNLERKVDVCFVPRG